MNALYTEDEVCDIVEAEIRKVVEAFSVLMHAFDVLARMHEKATGRDLSRVRSQLIEVVEIFMEDHEQGEKNA